MSDDPLFDLAPLAALGALDGEDKRLFEARLPTDLALRRALAVFERLVGTIGLATAPVEPAPALRGRLLASAGPGFQPAARPAHPVRPWWLGLAAAAGLVLVVSGLLLRQQRDAARREGARFRAEADSLTAQVQDARKRLDEAQRRLADATAFRDLVAHPASHVATLAGLPAAPGARARVVWNAERREAVLLASGLPPAPPGKAYEVWVIATAAPAPAGVFQVDPQGRAVHALPHLADVAKARTFAVTLEPEGGTPAPTGPMVLAGSAGP
jgi:anti-sigma-K factor RskA